jgi:hypothetical protein
MPGFLVSHMSHFLFPGFSNQRRQTSQVMMSNEVTMETEIASPLETEHSDLVQHSTFRSFLERFSLISDGQ